MAKGWPDEEMLVAVFLYRFGQDSLGTTIEELSKIMGRSVDAIKLRLLDLEAIKIMAPAKAS